MALDGVFYDFREMLLFEALHVGGNVIGSIFRGDGCGCLKYNLAAVAYIADIMNGDTGLGLVVCSYGFMDMMPVHALSAVFGKQGGVDVDDVPGISFDEKWRNHKQKACQHDEVDCVSIHHVGQAFTVVKLVFRHHFGRYTELFGSRQCECFGLVAENQGCFYVTVSAKISNDILTVAACAGNEYGYVCHLRIAS